MAQLDPSRYKRLSRTVNYGSSDGLYYDQTSDLIVLVKDDSIISSLDASGLVDILASEARGDILRRGASTWERHAAKTSGQILVGDGTDIVSVAVSGDVALASSGAATVTDLTITSEARGDLLRRGAAAWERVAAKTAGQVLLGDGTDVISAALSGAIASVSAAGSVELNQNRILYAEASIPSADITDTNSGKLGHAEGQQVIAAPSAGDAIEVISAVIINDFDTAAYTDGGNLTLNYAGGGAACTGAVSAANSLGAGADKTALVLGIAPTNNQLSAATAVNLVAAAAFTQPGTAAGVCRVKVAYRVHTTGL